MTDSSKATDENLDNTDITPDTDLAPGATSDTRTGTTDWEDGAQGTGEEGE